MLLSSPFAQVNLVGGVAFAIGTLAELRLLIAQADSMLMFLLLRIGRRHAVWPCDISIARPVSLLSWTDWVLYLFQSHLLNCRLYILLLE